MLSASMRRVAARISFVAFIIAAAGAFVAPPRAFAADTSPAHENDIPSLKGLFGSRFLVGAAVEPAQIADPVDAALLRRHYNSITAENVMKPRTIGTAVGVYNYGPADELVRFAVANAIRVRGHTLVWHRTAPDWFFTGDRSDPQAYRGRHGRDGAVERPLINRFRSARTQRTGTMASHDARYTTRNSRMN